LKKTFEALNFTVQVYNDLTWKGIQARIDHLANLTDHSTNDCLVICILSHGDVGVISAKDVYYELDTILINFTAEKCPSLAGKPKMFFVQACRGQKLDNGVELRTETDASDQSMSFKIPTYADFLIAFSTIPAYYSFRNPTKGGRFVQALCEELNRNGRDDDLLSILTNVKRMVAIEFQSNSTDPDMDGKKQMPCTVSMLTRLVFFRANILKGTMCCF
jgi:Caspase domain